MNGSAIDMSGPIYWMMIGDELQPCALEPRDASLIGDIAALERSQVDPSVREHVAKIRERVCEMVVESGRYMVAKTFNDIESVRFRQ